MPPEICMYQLATRTYPNTWVPQHIEGGLTHCHPVTLRSLTQAPPFTGFYGYNGWSPINVRPSATNIGPPHQPWQARGNCYNPSAPVSVIAETKQRLNQAEWMCLPEPLQLKPQLFKCYQHPVDLHVTRPPRERGSTKYVVKREHRDRLSTHCQMSGSKGDTNIVCKDMMGCWCDWARMLGRLPATRGHFNVHHTSFILRCEEMGVWRGIALFLFPLCALPVNWCLFSSWTWSQPSQNPW